jgi:thymidylate synthase
LYFVRFRAPFYDYTLDKKVVGGVFVRFRAPLHTKKYFKSTIVYWATVVLKGDTNIKYLQENGVKIWMLGQILTEN